MSYEIRNPEIEEKLKSIGHKLGRDMLSGWGFTLLIYSFGEGGSIFYISNANRADMLQAMKEFIKLQEH